MSHDSTLFWPTAKALNENNQEVQAPGAANLQQRGGTTEPYVLAVPSRSEGGMYVPYEGATEATLAQVRQILDSADFATETKLEQARALLASLEDKDFATQTTLESVLSRLDEIENRLTDGSQKTQLTGQLGSDIRRVGFRDFLAAGTTETVLDITTPCIMDSFLVATATGANAIRLYVEARRENGDYSPVNSGMVAWGSGSSVLSYRLSTQCLPDDAPSGHYTGWMKGLAYSETTQHGSGVMRHPHQPFPHGLRIRLQNENASEQVGRVAIEAVVREMEVS